ncbi:MAG: hypothetical protein HUK23_07875, partial [Sphaerochaetaceae bacterium]|nr:hypothetical protein [Sphaerochaetaceae bacterium]
MKKAAIALLAIILLCALVYLFVFDSVALVADSAWNQVLPTKTIFKLRCKLALEGQRLKLVKIDDGCLYNINELETSLLKLKDDYVVLSPVISNVASSNNLNIGTLLGDSIVAAIGNVNESLFDIVF